MAEIMYVDWDGLVYYDTRSKQYIKDLVDQTIKFGGHYVLKDVPAPGIETLHVAYKITDKFVVSPETAYFLNTCAGKTFEAGTVILVVEDGESDTYRFDILFEAYSGTPLTPDGELDLSDYYTRAQVDDLLAGKVSAAELKNYYLKTETDNFLATKADKTDLDGLATEEFVATAISAIEVPEVPTKVSDLENDLGFITTHQDISGKADVEHTHTLSDITDYKATDLSGYATEEFVNRKIAEAELADKEADLEAYYTKSEVDALIPDVSNFLTEVPEEYVTESELDARGYITEHQSLADYALKADVPTKVSDLANDAGYITEHIDISGKADIGHTHSISEVTDYIAPDLEPYALKTDIPSVEGFATETYVKNAIAEAELNEKEVDLTGYVTKDELEAVEEKIPSIEGLATETFVTNAISQIPEADFSNYYNKTETENLIDTAVGNIIVPDVSNLADKEHTHSIEDITDYVAPDLSGYAKLTDIPDVSNFITKVPEEYVTESELQLAIDNIEHPTVDTSNLLTKDEASTLLATKANDVPFADDYRVGTALGGFVADESLKGMTIVQIITKLLGLTLYVPPTSDLPEGTTPTVEQIITNEVPLYYLSNSGEPNASEFEYRTMTVKEGEADNQSETFMYQIVDNNGSVTESGYQIITEELDEGYLTIYVPESVTKFSVRIFDGLGGAWVEPAWSMIENTNYHLDGYKAYTADPAYDIYERMTIRVVIEN